METVFSIRKFNQRRKQYCSKEILNPNDDFFFYKNILFWIRRPPNKILAGKQSVCLCARKRMCCHKEQNACKKAKHAQIEKNARLLRLIFLDSFINDRIFFSKIYSFFFKFKIYFSNCLFNHFF